jgi:hypothetical protein
MSRQIIANYNLESTATLAHDVIEDIEGGCESYGFPADTETAGRLRQELHEANIEIA